jgi:curved DNA-binding protein CbpA
MGLFLEILLSNSEIYIYSIIDLMAYSDSFGIGRATFATQSKMVDYYDVLGLSNNATPEDIKKAYRGLAMKYHPDVNTTGETHEPNAQRFREIAEAYAVLSIPENKSSYDNSMMKRKPEAVFSSSKSEAMENNRKQRDATGHVPSPRPVRGSYAEHRLKQLEKERAKYNVNHLGYYSGGLPQKGMFAARKGSLRAPGMPHDPNIHNRLERYERDSHEVAISDADEFKADQFKDYEDRHRPKPYFTLETDETWRYVKNRTFATAIILLVFGSMIGHKVYKREQMRSHRTERLPENLSEKPAHHFVNKGGVLVKKEFIGFARYFKNDKELTEWYHKVYPEIMNPPHR